MKSTQKSEASLLLPEAGVDTEEAFTLEHGASCEARREENDDSASDRCSCAAPLELANDVLGDGSGWYMV